MNARRAFVASAALLCAVACTSGRPRARDIGPSIPAPVETIAPQEISAGPVAVHLSPQRLRSGRLVVTTTTPLARGTSWTASHAWLDREADGHWTTAWLLAPAASVPMEAYARGGVVLTDAGIGVPGTLTFRLDPAPPPGRYRLRLGVTSGTASPGGPAPTSWAAATLDVVA